jgi:Protein of unknown function (DUF4199)
VAWRIPTGGRCIGNWGKGVAAGDNFGHSLITFTSLKQHYEAAFLFSNHTPLVDRPLLSSWCFLTTPVVTLVLARRHVKAVGGFHSFAALFGKIIVAVVLVGVISTLCWYVERNYVFPERFKQVHREQVDLEVQKMKDNGTSQEQIDLQLERSRKMNESPVAQLLFPLVTYGLLGLVTGLIGTAAFRREQES